MAVNAQADAENRYFLDRWTCRTGKLTSTRKQEQPNRVEKLVDFDATSGMVDQNTAKCTGSAVIPKAV